MKDLVGVVHVTANEVFEHFVAVEGASWESPHRFSTYEIARAIRKAAAAASPPISAVCKALRTGTVPVK
jgi:hypothetical protein